MTVTIKAWTNANKPIELNYEKPQQCENVWEDIVTKGRAPTGEKLSRAYYWGPNRPRDHGPDRAWAA